MDKITRSEWRQLHRDYKTRIEGRPFVLKLTGKGTCERRVNDQPEPPSTISRNTCKPSGGTV